jgi:hypothetical protein
MNTVELVKYYADLLLLQYIGRTRAYSTVKTQVTPVVMPQVSVQFISFPLIPDSGYFTLSWGGDVTIQIPYNVTASELQDILRSLAAFVIDGGDALAPGPQDIEGGDALTTGANIIDGSDAEGFDLGGVVVTGSVTDGFTVTFVGTSPPADLLEVSVTTLLSGADSVTPVVTEIDETLPVAVMNGFNLTGDSIAVGAQLDILGKYAGVSRTGQGFTTQITLDDADYLTLIQLAIIKNNSGSSLETIVNLLYQFFGGEIIVYDYQDMVIEYSISSSIGSDGLLQLMVTEGLLPKPMAVGQIVVLFDDTNAFGFEFSTDSGGFGDLSDPDVGGEFASLYGT